MKIDKEYLEDQQVKLTVEVDADQLEASKRKAAKKIAKRIKVPGFRPGKAPYGVIRRQVGDEAIMEESLEILVNDIYPKVIEDTGIDPYGPGNLENVPSLDPVTLEFVVPLMADVELGDYKSILLPYEPPEVTEEDVEAVQNDFRQRQAVEETADRPAEVGDHVYLRLSAKRFAEDDESEQETAANLIDERSTSIIIAAEDADTSNEWPFAGFSRELIGMSTGEDKTLVHTFSEDSPYESLRGVSAQFSIHMEDVKARILPELNDEFAQSLGEYEDLDALQKDIRDSLEQRALETYNAEYDDEVIDKVIEISTIKFPPQMKEVEVNNVISQLETRLANQGLDMDIYLKTREMDEGGLREEADPVAESRVKRSLVLLEIAKIEDIDITEEELQQETTRTIDSITSYMSDADRKQFDSPQALMNLTGNIYAEMRINRTIEYLRNIASGLEEAEKEVEVEQGPESEELLAEISGEPDVDDAPENEATTAEEAAKIDSGIGETPEGDPEDSAEETLEENSATQAEQDSAD